MAVHQLVPTFTLGDATSQSAVHLQLLCRRLGLSGQLYAPDVAPALRTLVRPLSELRPKPEDLVLYHHGIGSTLSGRLLHLPCRRGIVFHNISPIKTYVGTPLEEALRSGRAQLSAMAAHIDIALGDSDFNCGELRAAGYANVHPVPLFVEPERFSSECGDVRLQQQLRGEGLTLISVSRALPHKRFEDLLSLHEACLRVDARSRLFLVGGYDAGGAYFKKVQARAKNLRGVRFLGRLSHAELVSAYRAAHVFVSMSEHEGFGVPLLEAMACGLPVLAYAAAAVPETLGGAGIAFTQKDFPLLAELASDMAFDSPLRERLLAGQTRRLKELSSEVIEGKLKQALSSLKGNFIADKHIPAKRPRVAFCIQRYGDVSGGSELLCKLLAHRLSGDWDITVLTSCAKNHLTWANEYPAGEGRDGPVRILRFETSKERNIRTFNALCRSVWPKAQDRSAEEHWIAEQGPLLSGFYEHLEKHQGDYDGYIFFTYLYATTVWGLPMVADRALFVPTTHDEEAIRLRIFDELFQRARGLICLSPEERAFVDKRFPLHAPVSVASVGLDVTPGNGQAFREKYHLDKPYLLYVGRVEAGKGIPELIQFYGEMARQRSDAPELLLAGASSMRVHGRGVRYLGRLTDEEKNDGLSGAVAAVVPSRHESLSLLALEAFAQGTPILANAQSEVLLGQVRRSEAGLTYRDSDSFQSGVFRLVQERALYGKKALAFAQQHTWGQVLDVYRAAMAPILEDRR